MKAGSHKPAGYDNGLDLKLTIIAYLRAAPHGTLTLPAIAQLTGRTRGNIKYHVDALVESGALVQTMVKRERWHTSIYSATQAGLNAWKEAHEQDTMPGSHVGNGPVDDPEDEA